MSKNNSAHGRYKSSAIKIAKGTVPLNYNFTITRVITRGITRTITCIPVTCLRGPRLLIAWNVHVSWYTRVEVSTRVE